MNIFVFVCIAPMNMLFMRDLFYTDLISRRITVIFSDCMTSK